MKNKLILLLSFLILVSCDKNSDERNEETKGDSDVQTYLDGYNKTFQSMLAEAAEAEWTANTKIVEGDTATQQLVQKANEAYSAFTGSKENIEMARGFLSDKSKLSDLQIRQLNAILYSAGGNPASAEEIVKKLITANAKQTEVLYGYDFKLNGKSITTNEIDKILAGDDKTLDEKLAAWNASKKVGLELKDGLIDLQNLRNSAVQALDYDDFFQYQVSDYGMSVDEMRTLTHDMISALWPLYRELHTWARHDLANRYKKPVPEMLPAHWLPNRWGQEWSSMVEVEGVDLDGILKEKSAEWIVKKGEEFYISLGFPALPESFYTKSSLYPLPEGASYKKNNHASAWHMNNAEDVRSLMSVEPNTKWWGTTLHELGHIYYYISYTNPDVPIILRGGANRAYHEGVGTMMGLAAMQKPFLQGLGLIEKGAETDDIHTLLKEALDYVVVVPWGAGVMTDFEWELYSNNLPANQFNAKWWELKKKYQGIVPPSLRGEEYCDAPAKTHINNDPAQYYDYAISTILFFQLHQHIADNILHQDPHATNYWGNKEVGKFLHDLMAPGASVDWREHLKKTIGKELSAQAMVDYFAPLMEWLKKENAGRDHTLPETI